jgi:bifunctional DNA-binding transcriptional regulator/antitoxin component of YhaV-PrlF toxin-antitoxin module
MDFKGSSTVFNGTIHLPKELKESLLIVDGDKLIFYKTKKCGMIIEKSEEDDG